MMRTVLKFGLLSGAVASVLLLCTMPFHDAIGFETAGLVVGYATMLLAFSLIYFGVRSYRDKVAGGTVRFGRALAVGALIGLVASLCYVATWEVMYFNFMPDFMDKFNAQMLNELKSSGASEAEVQAAAQEGEKFKILLANPLINIAFTLIEPLPVGLLITFISAAVLRRKQGGPPVAAL